MNTNNTACPDFISQGMCVWPECIHLQKKVAHSYKMGISVVVLVSGKCWSRASSAHPGDESCGVRGGRDPHQKGPFDSWQRWNCQHIMVIGNFQGFVIVLSFFCPLVS